MVIYTDFLEGLGPDGGFGISFFFSAEFSEVFSSDKKQKQAMMLGDDLKKKREYFQLLLS